MTKPTKKPVAPRVTPAQRHVLLLAAWFISSGVGNYNGCCAAIQRACEVLRLTDRASGAVVALFSRAVRHPRNKRLYFLGSAGKNIKERATALRAVALGNAADIAKAKEFSFLNRDLGA